MTSPNAGRGAWLLLASCCTLAACGAGSGPRRSGPLTPTAAPTGSVEAVRFYHTMGLAASAAPVPFVAGAAHFAGPGDSAHTLLSMSLPARALTFAREGERYRAQYTVDIRVLQNDAEVQRVEALEIVRVASFRETSRTDESLVFQRWLRLAPGRYTIRLAVRDLGSGAASSDTLSTIVPYFARGVTRVSSPLPVYAASGRTDVDSLPAVLARPRATAVFGRDSAVTIYAEAYGNGAATRLPVAVSVRNDAGALVWSDTASLPRAGELYSGILSVPIARVGMGVGFVSVAVAGSGDTTRTPYFVSFGEDLPVAPFEEMLSYLRFFVSNQRLSALRNAPAERRAQLWVDFLRDTDPVPTTPEHEALQSYFSRIQLANSRFREDIPSGWLSDRGSVYVALGDPDNVFEQTVTSSGGRRLSAPVRVQVWEYRQHRVQLTFTDEQQTGRFKFVPRSETEFRSLLQRVLIR